MRIYTRTGDSGRTGLVGGTRISKAAPRVEAYGTVDEVNALLGLTRALSSDDGTRDLLATLQHDLFLVGAELASPDANSTSALLGEDRVEKLEKEIDRVAADLPELKRFILPGGTRTAAYLHVARSVTRRAEREVVRLTKAGAEADTETGTEVRPTLLRYLNRLSDLLFVMARAANLRAGVSEVEWSTDLPKGEGE